MATSLFNPAGPVARSQILPAVNDRALSVEPEEFLQLLAHFARQTRPHSAAVRQLQRAQIPFGTARNVASRWRQIVVVAHRVFSRAVRIEDRFFWLANRHKPSVKMIYTNTHKKKNGGGGEKEFRFYLFIFYWSSELMEGGKK